MNLVGRYINGEREEVINEISLMGEEAFHPNIFPEID